MAASHPHMRASDAERNTIIDLLNQCTSDGRLTLDEYTERMEAAATARTYGELEALVEDLPVTLPWHANPPQGSSALVQYDSGTMQAPVRSQHYEPGFEPHHPLVISATWANENRRGVWTPVPYIELKPTGSNIELNFLEVESAPADIFVRVHSGMGMIIIVIPEGWGVNTVSLSKSMLGLFTSRVRDRALPGYPQIHLNGTVGMGTLKARYAGFFDNLRMKK